MEVEPPVEPDSPPPFRDRRSALTVAGVLLVITGVLVIGLGLLYGLGMPLLLRTVPHEPGMPQLGGYFSALLASVGAWFSAIGAAHVILGIGTFRFRKWAVDILVAACWAWIGFNALSLLGTLAFLPKLPALFDLAALSDGGEAPTFLSQGIAFFVFGAFLVFGYAVNLLPAIVGLAFLRSRDVRATIAVADPVPRWTTQVPEPALAWWALLVALAGTLVPLLPAYGWMLHLAGVAVSPVVGSLLVAVSAVVLAGLAWGTATRAPWAWAASVVALVVSGAISAVALSHLDIAGFYEGLFASMGTPDVETREMLPMMTSIYGDLASFQIVTALGTILLLGYLVWARRHFRQIP